MCKLEYEIRWQMVERESLKFESATQHSDGRERQRKYTVLTNASLAAAAKRAL